MALTKKQLETFKQRLMEMRRELTHSVRDASDQAKNPGETSGYSQHQADQGTDDFDRTISLELTTREVEKLKQIDRALDKIEEGSYGICDITKEEIPLKRLEAIPQATMTVQAQEKIEKGIW